MRAASQPSKPTSKQASDPRFPPEQIFLVLGAGDPANQPTLGISTEHRYAKLRDGFKVLKMLWISGFEKLLAGSGYLLVPLRIGVRNLGKPHVPIIKAYSSWKQYHEFANPKT